MSSGRLILVIFLSALVGGATSLSGFLWWQNGQTAPGAQQSLPADMASTDPASAQGRQAGMPLVTESIPLPAIGAVDPQTNEGGDAEERIITSVYANAAPAVVHIQTTSYVPTFFGEQTATGTGSGVIINKDGYILTNTHVVQGTGSRTALRVKMQDGTEYDAEYKGTDAETDLAVIKLLSPPATLPVAKIGNSDALRVGQRAIVIGNPYGFDSSISVGVVSALNRSIQTPQQRYDGMIQTDAAVNPGNSGGPMLNSLGQVIGINTVIYSQSGGSQGIGFAIPINSAMRIVSDLIQFGQVRRPWLGVRGMIPVGKHVARLLHLNIESGVLIQEVVPGSPGAKAGLKGGTEPIALGNGDYLVTGGDVIVSLNGKRVYRGDEVISAIRKMEAGQKAVLEIWRNNQLITVEVPLEIAPLQQ